MEFQINKIPFLNFNWQFEKELHNKEGKPNQKCGCNFICGNTFDYTILDEWKSIITLTNEKSLGKSDNLSYKDRFFEGKLPIEMDKFKGNLKYSENANVSLELNFLFDNKKLFEKLYKNQTIDIYFNDVTGIELLNDLPKGNITFNIKFIDDSLAPQAIPLLTNYQPNADGLSFTIQTDSSILDLDIDKIIDHIECENLYVIIKKDNNWKYKIDVQNYLWLLGKCDYEEHDDSKITDFKFTSNGKKIKDVTWDIFKGKIEFVVSSQKNFVYNIIKNNSLEDPYCKDPFKECLDGKSVNGKTFVLDEELPVNIPYDIVLGRKT